MGLLASNVRQHSRAIGRHPTEISEIADAEPRADGKCIGSFTIRTVEGIFFTDKVRSAWDTNACHHLVPRTSAIPLIAARHVGGGGLHHLAETRHRGGAWPPRRPDG